MRHVCSAAPPSSFFPELRQRNQTCESSPLPSLPPFPLLSLLADSSHHLLRRIPRRRHRRRIGGAPPRICALRAQISPLRASGCHEPPPFAQGPRLPAHQWVLGRWGPRPRRRDRGGGRCGHRSRRAVVVLAVVVPVGVVAGGGDVVVRAVHSTPGAQAGHPSGRRHQVRRRGKMRWE